MIPLPPDWAAVGRALNSTGAQMSIATVDGTTVAFVYTNGVLIASVPGSDVPTLLRNLAHISEQSKVSS